MSLSFEERSRKVIGALDPEEVAAQTVGQVIYENNFFARHVLGRVAGGGESLHLGIELSKRCTAKQLFVNSLLQISYMLEHFPELSDAVPSFIGVLAEKDKSYWPKAVLTEDPTEGGRYTLDPPPASGGLIEKSVHTVVEIGGQEKIMGFFPQPFTITREERDLLVPDGFMAQESLTVVFSDDSALAADIAPRA